MAGPSPIEWTDATWNPIVGCTIDTPGCINCYAMPMARRIEAMTAAMKARRATGAPHYDGTTKLVKGKAVWTGKLALAPDHILTEPLTWKKPRRIFVNSMGDLFHEDAPDEWIDRVFAVMALCPQHTFQVLTKRSARMRRYLSDPATIRRVYELVCDMVIERELYVALIAPGMDERQAPPAPRIYLDRWPLPNVWLGVSAEDQTRADQRIPDLFHTPAAVRFVSAEPLIGPIDFHEIIPDPLSWNPVYGIERSLDWIIVGGESGPKARPMHPAWARSIRDQCAAAGVAFFFKQWGKWAELDQSPAADEAGWQGRGNWMILDRHGDLDIPDHRWPDEEAGEVAVIDVGKKRAGRLLDGVEHNGFPFAGDRP